MPTENKSICNTHKSKLIMGLPLNTQTYYEGGIQCVHVALCVLYVVQ
jgi:hypothetical protein